MNGWAIVGNRHLVPTCARTYAAFFTCAAGWRRLIEGRLPKLLAGG